jgi:hypothetical protein
MDVNFCGGNNDQKTVSFKVVAGDIDGRIRSHNNGLEL